MKISELEAFDSTEAAKDPVVQEELLNMAWEDGDIPALTHALAVIAKARGMAETANKAGITRPALYKALSDKGNPSLSSLLGIMKALDIKATFHTSTSYAG
ncbi:putative transcriptional regulator [Gluconacetobacter johannae DSM 13595]|uniref:Putative addiction module antidote protein n=1 Tax=Gluconacetobacter johannae TaxID=112140 RepID=A0A7W4P3W1_9PROT|nr:addiction module antidote protein [Gluconacetobacter johannae]MBB2176264.1 putative addiction module antidote protein [Gluconacetobacter johannae]GBQ90661.1 putative transcriptional regulator [Gluconacetobacter johannae DSM 13595]